MINTIDQTKFEDYIAGQTDLKMKMVLTSFITGLDPKLGYIVRSNRPRSIKDAYDVCLNEISMQQSSEYRLQINSS